MSEPVMRRIPWGLTIAAGLALVLLLSLGIWQVQRLQWKEDLIARAEAAASADPRPLAQGAPVPFERVSLTCPATAGRRSVELQSIHDGTPGVRLITACVGYILDLGFVAETISARPRLDGPLIVTAVAREAHAPGPMALPPRDGRFYARDNEAIGAALDVPAVHRDLTLYAETRAVDGFEALQPTPPPAAFSNNHLGYAMTWFGLAIALVAFYLVLLRRKLTS
ncbi:SURF1 family protein [Brevundimonas sp. A19_0]|uniref:SURF1 family protein n=1 Tax=Brevundimonas sp. A19_0 TaxID=2821087 RepID=UPI001FD860B7|nr:SURF1 family protein [Brevundimonas sp. A19_0]